MKEIILHNGMKAVVDDDDYLKLSNYKWRAFKKSETSKIWYAVRFEYKGKVSQGQYRSSCIRMHRAIMGLGLYGGIQVDHINGNGLDNRRANLRLCTNQQNQWNQRGHSERNYGANSKGVTFIKSRNAFAARIVKDRKLHYIGYFKNEEDASRAYRDKAIELFGDFARVENCRVA